MKNLIIILLTLSIWGCTRILMITQEVKNPTIENYQSLNSFLKKKQIDTSEILCFRDTAALRVFYNRHIGLPESQFFNRNKLLVPYKSSPEQCNGMVSVFIENADSINLMKPIPGEKLEAYLEDVVYEADLRPFALEQEKYDLYLIMYWAKYLGKVNKHKVFEWLQLVEDARKRGLNIRVIKINADYQQGWGITEADLPQFNFKAK